MPLTTFVTLPFKDNCPLFFHDPSPDTVISKVILVTLVKATVIRSVTYSIPSSLINNSCAALFMDYVTAVSYAFPTLLCKELKDVICIGGGIFKYPHSIVIGVSCFPISLIVTIARAFISNVVLYFEVSVCLLVWYFLFQLQCSHWNSSKNSSPCF